MVIPVVGGPPQHSLLQRGLGEHCQDELPSAASSEALVREVPVIAGRDRKHPDDVDCEREGRETPAWREQHNANQGEDVPGAQDCGADDGKAEIQHGTPGERTPSLLPGLPFGINVGSYQAIQGNGQVHLGESPRSYSTTCLVSKVRAALQDGVCCSLPASVVVFPTEKLKPCLPPRAGVRGPSDRGRRLRRGRTSSPQGVLTRRP
jgi:hypothetical protein